jgi:glutamate N-acetyltransferase/amino-acid N-acetyltransferase
VLAFATGKAGNTIINCEGCEGADAFAAALTDVPPTGASGGRDGEGAQKFIAVTVTGAGPTKARAKSAGHRQFAAGQTAIAGEDANWGRIVMAVGKAGEPADRDRLSIGFGGMAGQGRPAPARL